MKKYIKYLLLIPIFFGSLSIASLIVFLITPWYQICNGLGCVYPALLSTLILPQITLLITIPLSILIYYLFSKYSGYLTRKLLEKPFPKKKIILLISIVALSLVVLMLISSLKTNKYNSTKSVNKIPSPTPTLNQQTIDNWNTYSNKNVGYELKYPQNWFTLRDDDYGFRISNKYFDPALDGVTNLPGQIFIDFYYFHSALENYSESAIEYKSTEGVMLVKQGKYLDDSGSFGIVITYRKDETNLDKLLLEVDQILSTLRFDSRL